MSTFKDIPIKLEIPNESASMLLPILNELVSKLKALISSGQSSIFDLRHEPLTSGDIDELKNILGRGEVDATLSALGTSNVRETAVAGIWWTTHYNEQGDVISEFIEVTTCPNLLKTFPDGLESALTGLQTKISEYTHRSTPDQIARRLNELGLGAGISEQEIN